MLDNISGKNLRKLLFFNFTPEIFLMKKTGLSLLILLISVSCFPEINTGNSIEWLCADAGLIASGRLKNYTKSSAGNNLWLCTFETTGISKGTSESPVSFTINNIPEDSLKKYVEGQTPMLIFLKENEKPYKSKKFESPWYIMETVNAMPAFINLDTPQKALISAINFSVLADTDLIYAMCQHCLKMIAEYEVRGKTVFMNYLKVPPQTAAYDILYSGNACYLTVPDFMFPDSKEKVY